MPGTRGLATNPPTSSTAISTLSLSASRRRLRYTANRRTATDNDAAKCASVASRPSSPRWSTRSSQPRITYSGAVIRSCSRRSAIEAPVPPVLGDLARPFVSFRLSFLDFNSWCFFLVFYSRVLARTRFENIYIYICYVGWIVSRGLNKFVGSEKVKVRADKLKGRGCESGSDKCSDKIIRRTPH